MDRVSVSMIIKDESERLPAALESLNKLSSLDEIVIVDTGSTDGSIDIARNFGAKVIEEPWRQDFAYHRNRSMAACRNNWIFVLDGDEFLEDSGDLDDLIGSREIDGVALKIHTVSENGEGERFHFVRAFDRRKGRWAFPIHNQVVGLGPVAISSARIVAYYDEDNHVAQTRRLVILNKALEANPDEPHHLFFGAKTHSLLGDDIACEALCDRYLNLKTTEELPDRATVWTWKVECLLGRGDVGAGRAALAEALIHFPDYPDLCFYAFLLSTKDWYESAARVSPRYLRAPIKSLKLAKALPEVVRQLGLPLEFAAHE